MYTLSFKNYLWIIRSKMSTSFRTLSHSCMWKKKVDWLHKKEIKTEKQTEDPEPPVFILRLVWSVRTLDYMKISLRGKCTPIYWQHQGQKSNPIHWIFTYIPLLQNKMGVWVKDSGPNSCSFQNVFNPKVLCYNDVSLTAFHWTNLKSSE